MFWKSIHWGFALYKEQTMKKLQEYARGHNFKLTKRRDLKYLTENETFKLCGKKNESVYIPAKDMDGSDRIINEVPQGQLRLQPKKMFGAIVEPKPKFLSVKGTSNHFQYDPEYKRWKKLSIDTNQWVVITEGAAKAAAAIDRGIPAISLSGVWNWKRRINGAMHPTPDFDDWQWGSRKVYICFDSDAALNPQVQHAARELAYELQRRGALVYNIELPSGKNDTKLGLDDYFGIYSVKRFQKLLASTKEIEIEPIIHKMNERYAHIIAGGKSAILREDNGEFELLQTSALRDALANHPAVKVKNENKDGEVKFTSVPLYTYWMKNPARRSYDGIIFNPNHDINGYYNLWKGFICEPKKGKWDKYRKHIYENICSGDKISFDYTIAWMADAIQNISSRPGVAYVMRGRKGTGKDVFVRHFGMLYGVHFAAYSQASHITGKFNAQLKNKLIVAANEAFWAGDKQGEGVLKSMITDDTISIEFKGKDVFDITNMIRLFVMGNADWVAPASDDERRFFITNVNDAHRLDHKYFAAIEKQMHNGGYEALLYYLIHYDLHGINLRDVPVTEALIEQKELTMDTFHQWWQQKLTNGWLWRIRDGWGCGGVDGIDLRNQYLEYCNEMKERYPINPTHFGRKLKKITGDNAIKVKKRNCTSMYRLPSLNVCRKYFDEFLGKKAKW